MAYGGIGSTTLMQNSTKMTLLRVIPHQLTCILAFQLLLYLPFRLTHVCVYIYIFFLIYFFLFIYFSAFRLTCFGILSSIYIYTYIYIYYSIFLHFIGHMFRRLLIYIYIYLGLQKINNFWSTPNVLLFLDANSKSRGFGRYLKKPVVSFMPSTATLNFLSLPDPLNWL